MNVHVTPGPGGRYLARLRDHDDPVSSHLTRGEAEAAAHRYALRRTRDAGAASEQNAVLVRLRGGTDVLIRAVGPDDKPHFVSGFARLGPDSRYRRFLGVRGSLTTEELEELTDVDGVDHLALGAIDSATGQGIGVARYRRLVECPTHAEVAVAVVDAWQRRGVGEALLRRLAARAVQQGIRRFSATLLAHNHASRVLLGRLGAVRVLSRDGATLEVDVELPLTRGTELDGPGDRDP